MSPQLKKIKITETKKQKKNNCVGKRVNKFLNK